MLVNFNQGYTSPQFQRKPNSTEMKKYTRAVSQGLNVLNKEVGIIVHNSSAPSVAGKNLGIGSLLSTASAALLMPFLSDHGLTKVQQEPDNIRGPYKPSPYIPVSSSKNIYMIPIEKLSTEEYGKILAEEDIEGIYERNAKRMNPNKVDYAFVYKEYTKALEKAYKNFTTSNEIPELKAEFEAYKDENYEDLEPNAVYEILVLKNKDEDWKQWKSDADRNLYMSEKYTAKREDIIEKNKEKIGLHIFKQWLLDREAQSIKENNDKLGIKIIGDSPVAVAPAVVWRNQDLYFEDLALGCRPDAYAPNGQRWGFAVLKPETLFNPDGTLGKGGELMKQQYEKIFKTASGGARIDHIIGLIDPFVYTQSESKMTPQNSGRLYSSPNHPILGKYARKNDEEYSIILEKIVFPAAEKYGLTKDDIICEDLGEITKPVRNVMDRLNLSGIAITEFDYRGKEQGENKVIMLGSHDNSSFVEYTDRIFDYNENEHRGKKAEYLAKDTSVPNENREQYQHQIFSDKRKFMLASFAELFTSPAKRVQLFFTDFFGIGETYNKPGSEKDCWALRMPENFEDVYYKNLQKGTALNLPEVIARAIRNKGPQVIEKNKTLLAKLDEFANILKS